jgi:hypothetical protein
MGLEKEMTMALDERGQPVRRGVPRQFTIDHDAAKLLAELATGPKGQGHLISELLRAEVSRREERERLRQERLVEVGSE